MEQLNILNEWPLCFTVCKNFTEGTPFPVSGEPRCDYGIKNVGTGGEDLELWTDGSGTVRMRCVYFEERRIK